MRSLCQTTNLPQKKKTEARLKQWLKEYPDLVKSVDVAKTTGYSIKSVFFWCYSGKLHHFCIRRAILIQKLSLLDFMMSDNFRGIKVMKEEYGEFWARYSDEDN